MVLTAKSGFNRGFWWFCRGLGGRGLRFCLPLFANKFMDWIRAQVSPVAMVMGFLVFVQTSQLVLALKLAYMARVHTHTPKNNDDFLGAAADYSGHV